jgi:hypothetical protein
MTPYPSVRTSEPALSEASDRPHHLFIVRLWRESGHPSPGQWRGSVEHVPSGRRLYFVSLSDLADFITLRLDADISRGVEGPRIVEFGNR